MNKAQELCDIANSSTKELERIYNCTMLILRSAAEQGAKSFNCPVYSDKLTRQDEIQHYLYYHPQAKSLQDKLKSDGFIVDVYALDYSSFSLFSREPKPGEPVARILINFCRGC